MSVSYLKPTPPTAARPERRRVGNRRSDVCSSDRRDFHIAASDVGHRLVLPRMLEWVREMAPNVRFKAVPLGGEKLIARLETGEVDVAIGSFPALYAGVVEQTLFPEEYVCVVPRTHLPNGR